MPLFRRKTAGREFQKRISQTQLWLYNHVPVEYYSIPAVHIYGRAAVKRILMRHQSCDFDCLALVILLDWDSTSYDLPQPNYTGKVENEESRSRILYSSMHKAWRAGINIIVIPRDVGGPQSFQNLSTVYWYTCIRHTVLHFRMKFIRFVNPDTRLSLSILGIHAAC